MSIWGELLEYGRWAPSPHNIQPWRLSPLTEREAELFYEPARLLHETDPAGRFVTVGLGVFVETLSIAAAPLGQAVEAALLGASPSGRDGAPRPFARLQLVSAPGTGSLDRELILTRRTSRLPYDHRPIARASLEEAEAIAAEFGHRLTASSDPELVRFVLELNQEALFFDMTDARARREIGSWLRFSARASEQAADGFSPACLGFPGWLLYAFFHWRQGFELPAIRQLVRRYYLRTMRGTATVAWLHGPFATLEDWFRAGRVLCRLWLAATAAGAYLHPFGSVVTNEAASARLKERIDALTEGELWLVMRLGYGARPPGSARLPLNALLLRP